MISTHHPVLVVLSIVIACAASYAGLFLASHVANTKSRLGWLLAAACAMGVGIWSMHFIAMLAYRLPVSVGYDLPLVALSLLIAIAASGVGLSVAGQQAPRRLSLLLTGPVMGVAIAGMHYTGMASMRLAASRHYDLLLVLASVGVAVVASYAAIALFLRFRHDCSQRGAWLKAASAVVMGHAVAGMHYTAMTAVHFEHARMSVGGVLLQPHKIGIAIAIATVLVLGLTIAGAMLDRWARRTAEIRRNEERFRAMVDAMQDYAIFTLDAAGRVDSWSRGAERLSGFSAAEAIGQPLPLLHQPELRESIETELRHAAELGRFEVEATRVSRTGELFHVSSTTTAMHDERGALIGFARVVRDMTEKVRTQEELKRSEGQLLQAQKMEAVGQLAGGVAHDLNNMLTAIRGYADLLRHDTCPEGDVTNGLLEITRATDRAAELTRHLLAFSRKQMMQPRPLDPNECLAQMEGMLRRLLVGDVELVSELGPDAGTVVADPAQLEQVLLNLTLNARDAMPRGGRIVIRSWNVELDDAFCRSHPGSVRGPHVAMSVSDSGVGMRSDVMTHIFEPFFTTKPIGAGTGLGLSTVYGIVKQSGGYITVESEPGRGSIFTVYLPRTSRQPAAQSVAPPLVRSDETRHTLLLVDDEDAVRTMLATLLRRQGYTVLVARDGVQALEVAGDHQGTIDLLVTDMMMPRMHGRDLAGQLVESRANLRVIFMSGYANDSIIQRGLLDERMTFIQKPFEASELIGKVRSTLEGPVALAS
jgi:PAS domain S-box-containing protein